jgi:hypothetical protein
MCWAILERGVSLVVIVYDDFVYIIINTPLLTLYRLCTHTFSFTGRVEE